MKIKNILSALTSIIIAVTGISSTTANAEVLKGDANLDGRIDLSDLLYLKKVVLQILPVNENCLIAENREDNIPRINDMVAFRKAYFEYQDCVPMKIDYKAKTSGEFMICPTSATIQRDEHNNKYLAIPLAISENNILDNITCSLKIDYKNNDKSLDIDYEKEKILEIEIEDARVSSRFYKNYLEITFLKSSSKPFNERFKKGDVITYIVIKDPNVQVNDTISLDFSNCVFLSNNDEEVYNMTDFSSSYELKVGVSKLDVSNY